MVWQYRGWVSISPLGKKKPEANESFSWKQLAKEDFKGAVTTAGGGVCASFLGYGPLGWKACGALVLGGAVTGSLDNAIEQLWPDEEPEKSE